MNLNCMYHDDRPAVAQCVVCGVGLCKDCAEKYEPIVCEKCASQVNQDEKKLAKRRIICTAVIFALFILIGIYGTITETANYGIGKGLETLLMTPVMAWIFAGFPSGWRAVSKIKLDAFLILPIVGWVFYFVIKLVLAFFVGIVAMPIELIKYIRILKN